jgi:hypothetical protein
MQLVWSFLQLSLSENLHAFDKETRVSTRDGVDNHNVQALTAPLICQNQFYLSVSQGLEPAAMSARSRNINGFEFCAVIGGRRIDGGE